MRPILSTLFGKGVDTSLNHTRTCSSPRRPQVLDPGKPIPYAQPDWRDDFFVLKWVGRPNEHGSTAALGCEFTGSWPSGEIVGLTITADRQELSRYLPMGVIKKKIPMFEHHLEQLRWDQTATKLGTVLNQVHSLSQITHYPWEGGLGNRPRYWHDKTALFEPIGECRCRRGSLTEEEPSPTPQLTIEKVPQIPNKKSSEDGWNFLE